MDFAMACSPISESVWCAVVGVSGHVCCSAYYYINTLELNTRWGFWQILATLNGLTLRDSRLRPTSTVRQEASMELLQTPRPASRMNVAL